MIIASVQVRWISDEKGYGLFATQTIPKGTITFVQDGLDIVIPHEKQDEVSPALMEYVDKYSFEDYLGNRIISWDLGKYMNHDDEANTLTTGYGFEIAIRDIQIGEEVTDDYRIFSTHHDTSMAAQTKKIEELRPWPGKLINEWNNKVNKALKEVNQVEQPLLRVLGSEVFTKILRNNKLNSHPDVADSLPLRYKTHTQNSF